MDHLVPLEPALEKGIYATFHQNVMSWRPASIANKVVAFNDLQLPTGSVLHTLDQLLSAEVQTVLPDLRNPFIHNEKSQVFLETLTQIPGSNVAFPITDRYRFRPNQYATAIRQFWTAHPEIHRATSRTAMVARPNALPVFNYNAILTAQVTGSFNYYRHFDLLFRTILDTVIAIEDKHQFIQIPLSRTVYRKLQFNQTFNKLTYQTVRVKDDPSFYFLLHLVNLLAKTATTSLFAQLTPVQLDQLNLIFTAGDKAVIYNLGDLVAMNTKRQDDTLYQMVIRHITALKLAGYADMDISHLDAQDFDKLVEDVAPGDPAEDGSAAPISTPAVPAVAPDPHNVTRTELAADQPPPSPTPIVPARQVKIPPLEASVPSSQPSHVLMPTAPQLVPVTHQPSPPHLAPYSASSITSVIDHSAHQAILAASYLTDAQRQRAIAIAQSYKTLKVDGQSVDALLEQSAEPAITTGHLAFLAEHIPDQSMLDSTAVDLDQHYLEHMMARDIASVAAQMTAHGMFLVDITQRDEITQLDRVRHYRLVYEDLTGRTHRVTFRIPIIAHDGTIMINGIESRMIKQQVNLPICKVDTWRVSLASNYNKTLVERVTTKAHNYSAYITRYLAQVYKAKIGLTLNYGNLTTAATLPYDYSSIAQRYSRLMFGGYRLVFDYAHRFAGLVDKPYNEFDSTFSYDGNVYSVTSLLQETAELPTQSFAVDDLKWILDEVTPDPDRPIEGANLTAPILVTKTVDGLVTIDGLHRLSEAIRTGVTTLPGKLVTKEMLQRHLIGPDEGSEAAHVRKIKTILSLETLETTYGVYCGIQTVRSSDGPLRVFFGYDNYLRIVNLKTKVIQQTISFADLIFAQFGDKVPTPKPLSEWTELKILDKNFPVIFILGFMYGLQRTLDHIGLQYNFVPSGEKLTKSTTLIVVPFADGNLCFDRYPLKQSFIASGLLRFNTKPYAFKSLDSQDGYYTVLSDHQLSMNYLKGIANFFQLFIDPITRDVLLRMHEPTDVAGLLIRATEMLTTDDAIPSASMKNHRLRGYERFPTTLYNEMSRAYAAFSNQRGNRKVFSINPEAVFLRLIGDQTLRIVDEINPVENVKDKHSITYTGSGGRTAQSFVIEDRRYPDDGLGVLSECTPDNGKVGINSYISANPVIANARGMFDLDKVDRVNIQPSQILSVTSLLMPCATNDNAPRANFINIQLKHHVPSEYSETMWVRTGYETVLAHRTSETYACVAKRDGVVTKIDPALQIITVQYHTTPIPPLDLKLVSTSPAVRQKFDELAFAEVKAGRPVYLVQLDGEQLSFQLNQLYQFHTRTMKVQDILPVVDLDAMPMHDYLSGNMRNSLATASHPVIIKLIATLPSPTADVDIFKFGTKFTSVSGSFLEQTIVVNVAVGAAIKQGDVIAFNSGFFEPDPLNPTQVSWKHGVMANVVLMEANDTVEDSSAITKEFSHRLAMRPAHMRVLQMTKDTAITELKPVGTDVQTTDLLCTLEDADIASLTDSDDRSMLDLLTDLNRKAPRAKYHGKIAELDVLYACPISEMHPTLQSVIKQIDSRKHALAKIAAGTDKYASYAEPALVKPGTKFHGIDFEADTVLLIVYITEEIDQDVGSKTVLCSQGKTITASIIEEPISTESGYPIDMLFSARSVSNRIILSPTIVGTTNRVLSKLCQAASDLYFGS